MRHRRSIAALTILLLALALAPASALSSPSLRGQTPTTPAGSGPPVAPVDCEGPAPDAEPGTTEWRERDLANVWCTSERHLDQAQHPNMVLPAEGGTRALPDAYRDPGRHDGVRFRYEPVTIAGLDAEVYRPCPTDESVCPDLPEGLGRFDGPYPAAILIHGLTARKEFNWFASQPLAEAGYLVVAFKSAGVGPTVAEAEAVLDWLTAGEHPLAADADPTRIGIAGHSQGGGVSSTLGQRDDRIGAIVGWDQYTGSLGENPDTPTLFILADYLTWPGHPQPYLNPPDPEQHRGDGGFDRLVESGVDAMRLALRASAHLDWTPSQLSGSRYAELVTVYYTLAWFDRYLRGADDPDLAQDAFARLTAEVFDDSADRHNISQGFFDPTQALASADPLYGGNVPYSIAGLPVADRLSFYFLSKCSLSAPRPGGSAPGLRAASDDMRTEGCRGERGPGQPRVHAPR
jgi:dienelactone hydrolase